MTSSKKPYALRVDELEFEKLKLIAKANHRSINLQIEALISECIKTYEAENGEVIVNLED